MLRRVTVAAVPAKVAVAQEYLKFAEVARAGGPACVHSDVPLASRDLTPHEQAVYDHSLEVLRLYLSGECTFEIVPTDDDKPPSRELVED